MPRIARAHHFVPQFLLAGFTPVDSKEGFLWASDRKTGKQWHTTPQNVAQRKDFYRVEIPKLAPDAIETSLSKMEGYASTIVREILLTSDLPSEASADYMILMEFIALMSVRVPSGRELVNEGVDVISKQMLRSALRTPETWKSELARARAAGIDIDEASASYERMTEALATDAYNFTVDQNYQIKVMLEMMGKLAPCLAARKWCLAVSESGSLISSDAPVAIRFTRPKPLIDSPGFMREDTEITFPLSRNVLLVGSWKPHSIRLVPLTRKAVAYFNGVTVTHSQRFLFSPVKDFCWLAKDRTVHYDFGPLVLPAEPRDSA